MRAVKIIRDPEAFTLLGDETRRRIVYLLRAKERTVSQIAEELGLTPQAIYHHIRKMKDAGMIEVAREERVDHFIETYYRATAEIFHFTHGEGGALASEVERMKEALEGLKKIGVNLNVSEEMAAKILRLADKMDNAWHKSNWADKASELEDVDFFVKQTIIEYSGLMSMTDDEFDEHCKTYKELRDVLRSGMVQQGRPKKK